MSEATLPDHPLRYELSNELHARPFPELKAPCRAAFLAIKKPSKAFERDRALDRQHLIDLLDRHGAMLNVQRPRHASPSREPPSQNPPHSGQGLEEDTPVWTREYCSISSSCRPDFMSVVPVTSARNTVTVHAPSPPEDDGVGAPLGISRHCRDLSHRPRHVVPTVQSFCVVHGFSGLSKKSWHLDSHSLESLQPAPALSANASQTKQSESSCLKSLSPCASQPVPLERSHSQRGI
jgi:hypothetical protein